MADFWDLLISRGDAIGEMPERAGVRKKEGRQGPAHPDSLLGGYLRDIDEFDADFFRISPHEAVRLDPQNRMLMEVVWEALEDAGLTAGGIARTRTGVYTSTLPSGYWDLLRAAGIEDLHAVVGAGPWQVAAGRISYELDLTGPSMGLEATCATSLLAVHLACRALWAGEIDMAIVGSANLLIDAELSAMLTGAGLLSRTGRCKFGDAGGDGYVRAEGAAAIILKACRRAVTDGDRVHALIAGTSATHDGRSGRTQFAPGLTSQELMLRTAYSDAGIPPGDVDYVEAHGPGTPAGDLVELTALQHVMGEGRRPDEPCIVGSVKSNIGHCEPASGLAGLIKAILAMRHGQIPPSLHMTTPHPVLERSAGLMLPASAMDWPRRGHRATAGVSAFGLSGTNVHIVLTEPPASRGRRVSRRGGAWLLPVSARDPEALRNLARRYGEWLAPSGSSADLHHICFSAGTRRTHHEYRLAAVGPTAAALADGLRSYARGGRPESVVTAGAWPEGRPPRVVFVFPGQGPMTPGMGAGLLAACPAFARKMHECDRALEAETGWTASRRLASGEDLGNIADIQPVTWAIQVSLAALWQDWGIEPDAVIGHSMGEVAAATVAGALGLREAAAVVCRRSRLLGTLSGRGAMWAVALGEDAARAAAAPAAGKVCVGVINSDRSVVLAGEIAACEEVIGRLRERGVRCRRLPVDAASHAPLVDELRAAMLAELEDLRPKAGRIRIFSSVKAAVIDGTDLTAAYWMDNMRSPVRFEPAVRRLLAESCPGDTLCVEISPHPILLWAIEDIAASAGVHAASVPSLRPDTGELDSLLVGLARAYVLGCDPAWDRVYPGGCYVPLPGYPWNRRSYWPAVAAGGRRDGRAQPDEARPASRKRAPVADLLEQILAQVSDLLAVDRSEIDASAPLTRMGLDSLHVLRLRERIQENLGMRVPLSELLESSSLGEMCRTLGRLKDKDQEHYPERTVVHPAR